MINFANILKNNVNIVRTFSRWLYDGENNVKPVYNPGVSVVDEFPIHKTYGTIDFRVKDASNESMFDINDGNYFWSSPIMQELNEKEKFSNSYYGKESDSSNNKETKHFDESKLKNKEKPFAIYGTPGSGYPAHSGRNVYTAVQSSNISSDWIMVGRLGRSKNDALKPWERELYKNMNPILARALERMKW